MLVFTIVLLRQVKCKLSNFDSSLMMSSMMSSYIKNYQTWIIEFGIELVKRPGSEYVSPARINGGMD